MRAGRPGPYKIFRNVLKIFVGDGFPIPPIFPERFDRIVGDDAHIVPRFDKTKLKTDP